MAKPLPPADKIVSLFEPHTNIIVKGGRDVEYGHKLNLDHRQERLDPRSGGSKPATQQTVERFLTMGWSATSRLRWPERRVRGWAVHRC